MNFANVNISVTPGTGAQDEENRQYQLAIAKCRQVHTNTSKILLRIKEEVAKNPKSAAHGEVIGLLKGYEKTLDVLYNKYEYITIHGVIPNATEPTTSAVLRRKIVEDTRGYPFPPTNEQNEFQQIGKWNIEVFQNSKFQMLKLDFEKNT